MLARDPNRDSASAMNLLNVVLVPNVRNDDVLSVPNRIKQATGEKVRAHMHPHGVRQVNHRAPRRHAPTLVHTLLQVRLHRFGCPLVQGRACILDGLGQPADRVPVGDQRSRNRILTDARPSDEPDDRHTICI